MSQFFFGAPEDFAVMPQEDVATIPPVAPAGVIPPPPDSNRVLPHGFFGVKTVTNTSEFIRDGRKIKRTTYSDGTFDEEDLGEADSGGGDDTTTIAGREFDEDAYARLTALLGRIGLEGLTGNIRELVAKGITDSDAILFELRGTTEYKTRFAGNAARAAKGLPELSPATYVALENSYRDTMRAAGLPAGFYDESSDFRKLIENDVSVSELNSRVQEGYVMVRDADPEVKRQMQRLYNVSENELAAYFLDPERAAPILTKQAQAARVSARAREQAGFDLTATSAEDLLARGYTPQQAQATFERLGELSGLYQEMGGEERLTEAQKIGAAFGYDVESLKKIERRQRERIAEFQAGGQFARTTGATSGTIETGVGTAQ